MKFSELGLANAFSIETKPLSDSRGYFNRVFCAEEFSKYNLPTFGRSVIIHLQGMQVLFEGFIFNSRLRKKRS